MNLKTQISKSIFDFSPEDWRLIETSDFPFNDYDFLASLEESGSIGENKGWMPFFISVWKENELLAACNLYLKNHSYGEYIFDWSWADAFQRNGISYYPKLLSAIPFTPSNGPKILMRQAADKNEIFDLCIHKVNELAESLKASSIHFLFTSDLENKFFHHQLSWIERASYQYHWKNPGYQSFDDFLSSLKSKRRKEIIRERRNIDKELKIQKIIGEEISLEHLKSIFEFYLDTIEKKYSHAYLNWEFFNSIFQRMRDRMMLVIAEKQNKIVAGSIFFHKGEKLYGRYWGCIEDYQNLHFELCYYQGIEYSIEKNIKTFEAGAQGSHKLNRGFLPTITWSNHRVFHPAFSDAIKDFCIQEKKELQTQIQDFQSSPYKMKN